MKYFTKEVKIALVAIMAIVVLFVGMQFLKGMSIFSSDDVYYVRFADVTGLSPSSPVYANGYKVGVVRDISYDYSNPGNIIATIGLDPKLQIRRGTKAEILSDLLGNVRLELRFATTASGILAKGDTIDGYQESGLMGKAAEMLPEIEALLPKLDSILTNVNILVSNPAISGTINNAENLTASLKTTATQLNQLTAQLNQKIPKVMGKADGLLDNANKVTENLGQLDLQATMGKVDRSIENLEQLTAKLSNPSGNLGLLLNDTKLYDNMLSSMNNLDSLLIDLKSHPKRYVHFSVFGRKDK